MKKNILVCIFVVNVLSVQAQKVQMDSVAFYNFTEKQKAIPALKTDIAKLTKAIGEAQKKYNKAAGNSSLKKLLDNKKNVENRIAELNKQKEVKNASNALQKKAIEALQTQIEQQKTVLQPLERKNEEIKDLKKERAKLLEEKARLEKSKPEENYAGKVKELERKEIEQKQVREKLKQNLVKVEKEAEKLKKNEQVLQDLKTKQTEWVQKIEAQKNIKDNQTKELDKLKKMSEIKNQNETEINKLTNILNEIK
jgi:chromosome segregation ATPase